MKVVWPTFVVSHVDSSCIAYIRLPRYNWNIVESGIKYHIPNPYIRVCMGWSQDSPSFPDNFFLNYNEKIACNAASDENSWNPFSND